ncbi:hypothetical protein BDV24DRAFT_146132 [Aspergillus arachidicola]|uniref:Nephrocystin 3-like N-terminal domain-containing protein n=1 Tax=Aspergillus arachidicola TaxID=656916 RepID=A0A5N6XM00_9EURO|nr:hypothetical protein BDV24DRAFT_146132 [Aspergillus arachidicola]
MYILVEWGGRNRKVNNFANNSTISKGKGHLGASFFFKRGERGRSTAKMFFTTICVQLLLHVPALIRHIDIAIDTDPFISERSMKEKFDKLIFQPLLCLNEIESKTIILVIDALDECEEKDNIQAILQLLPQVHIHESICLRIFLTGRPELAIRLGFKQNDSYQDLVLHELSMPIIKRDITYTWKTSFRKSVMNVHWRLAGLVTKLLKSWYRWLFHYSSSRPQHVALLEKGPIQIDVSGNFLISNRAHLYLRWTKYTCQF